MLLFNSSSWIMDVCLNAEWRKLCLLRRIPISACPARAADYLLVCMSISVSGLETVLRAQSASEAAELGIATQLLLHGRTPSGHA